MCFCWGMAPVLVCGVFMCVSPELVNVCSADDVCPCWCQVKVMTERELLGYACEQFLGKTVVEIKSVILQTLEGHLRAILGGYHHTELSSFVLLLGIQSSHDSIHIFFSSTQ